MKFLVYILSTFFPVRLGHLESVDHAVPPSHDPQELPPIEGACGRAVEKKYRDAIHRHWIETLPSESSALRGCGGDTLRSEAVSVRPSVLHFDAVVVL